MVQAPWSFVRSDRRDGIAPCFPGSEAANQKSGIDAEFRQVVCDALADLVSMDAEDDDRATSESPAPLGHVLGFAAQRIRDGKA